MFKKFVILGGLLATIAMLGTSCGSESSSTNTTGPDGEINGDTSSSVEESSSTSQMSSAQTDKFSSASENKQNSTETQSNESRSGDLKDNSSSSQASSNSTNSVNSSNDETLVAVATYNDLPHCRAAIEDSRIFVKDDDAEFVCLQNEWRKVPVHSKVYKTMQIGSQIWMAENLNIDVPNSFYDENTPDYRLKYGLLYTWAAAVDSIGLFSKNSKGCGSGHNKCYAVLPIQGICPKGWHLPTKEEFETLIETVGGVDVAGKKLKSAEGWAKTIYSGYGYLGTNANGTDDYGFTALPAGDWQSDVCHIGYSATFWTSTESNPEDDPDDYGKLAYCVELGEDYKDEDISLDGNKAYIDEYYKDKGYSVRCVKD